MKRLGRIFVYVSLGWMIPFGAACARVTFPYEGELDDSECLDQNCITEDDSDRDSGSDIGNMTDSETGNIVDSDTGSGPAHDTSTNSAQDTDSGTGPEMDTDTGTGPETDTDTDTGTGLADPICEGFDNWAVTQANWQFWTEGVSNSGWQNWTDTMYHNGDAGLIEDWFVSPAYDLSLMTSPSLDLFYRSHLPSTVICADIYISTTTASSTAEFTIHSIVAGTDATDVTRNIDLSAYAGEATVYVAFVYGPRDNSNQFLIDDFCIEDSL